MRLCEYGVVRENTPLNSRPAVDGLIVLGRGALLAARAAPRDQELGDSEVEVEQDPQPDRNAEPDLVRLRASSHGYGARGVITRWRSGGVAGKAGQ